MNRTPTILSVLALLGVITLFILHFSSSSKGNGAANSVNVSSNSSSNHVLKIAYVDIDSFEAHYESLKIKKAEFKAQQEAMENELQRSAGQMQADYASLQKKAQANQLSQSEGEAAQKRLGQMQQSLEARKSSMSAQFQEKLESFNTELHKNLDDFLADYTKTKNFDYVLSYTNNNPLILYADKALNITDDVIKGMNERAGKQNSKGTANSK